jgi:hypothetical protein
MDLHEAIINQLKFCPVLEDASIMLGQTIYGPYQDNDSILLALELGEEGIPPAPLYTLLIFTERHIEQFESEYELIEMKNEYPVVQRKE